MFSIKNVKKSERNTQIQKMIKQKNFDEKLMNRKYITEIFQS